MDRGAATSWPGCQDSNTQPEGSQDHDFDCFYVYPTVNLSAEPGNDTDFSNIDLQLDPLLNQAARFTEVCRVFAPLYRQATIGTNSAPPAVLAPILQLAYGDVRDAFAHYMGQYNEGRNFAIIAHSQGTSMTTRLVQDFIDRSDFLRSRLVSALLIGGGVTVPEGELVGGSFENLPLCTSILQSGCVIAYRSYADGYPPVGGSNVVGPEGFDTACTNPSNGFRDGLGTFTGSYFQLFSYQPLYRPLIPENDFTTGFVLYPTFYTGECVKDDRNRSYLRIGVAGDPEDVRSDGVPYDNVVLDPSFLGTHVLDFQFALRDLIDIVQTQAANMQ